MKILFGDQVPRNGGLLRMTAALQSRRFEEVVYCRQDADTPWRETGQARVKITDRWCDYWSLGVRFPWTLSVPQVDMQGVRASLRIPTGLSHLAGPRTNITLHTFPQPEFDAQLYGREVDWFLQLSEYLGIEARPAPDFEDGFGQADNGLVSMFQEEPPKLLGQIPSEYFWEIDLSSGTRVKWDGTFRASKIYVPSGIALPLEVAARSMWIGCTSLGYLTRSLELRDRFLQGHSVSVCVVSFSWQLSYDPLEVLQSVYVTRRKAAGKQAQILSPEDVSKILAYWRQRPTSLGYHMLGGQLNPSFNFHVL